MINIDVKTYNNMVRALKHCVALHESRVALTYIELKCSNGQFIATALDGFKMGQVRGDCSDGELYCLLPPMLMRGKGDFVGIDKREGTVSLTLDDTTITKRVPDVPFINWRQIVDNNRQDITSRIALSPKLLRQLADTYDGESSIILEIGDDLNPVLVHGGNRCGMILPVRISSIDAPLKDKLPSSYMRFGEAREVKQKAANRTLEYEIGPALEREPDDPNP